MSTANPPIPPADLIYGWAENLYTNAVDRSDAAGFAAAFTPDASLRFGNADPIQGRDAIEAAIAHFFSTFATLRHQSRGACLCGETLFLEAVVTYQRHDGREVSVPALTVFHLSGTQPGNPVQPVADECRIYVDLSPLYA